MNTEVNSTQLKALEKEVLLPDAPSVCETPEQQERLIKLFELFIQIDQRLQHESNEKTDKGNTNSSR
ncbi:hypothetical protein KJ918_04855 [Patescibacteria group bacterium]|nr:hypothetical protein [Patescibacteria group bacterium]